MMQFDHVALAGETLHDAVARTEEALDVPLQPGGEHAVFHTHNALLGLEDGLYFEVIAINPDAPKPDRPRWFDLDRFSGPPRLTNWICAVENLEESLAAMPTGFGQPVALQRGDLRWQMAVPADGILPFDNCAPALITWQSPVHPATSLIQRGVRLRRLTVSHPQVADLEHLLSTHLRDDRIAFETGSPGLSTQFDTPHGLRELS